MYSNIQIMAIVLLINMISIAFSSIIQLTASAVLPLYNNACFSLKKKKKAKKKKLVISLVRTYLLLFYVRFSILGNDAEQKRSIHFTCDASCIT